MGLVSVLMPVYNSGKFVHSAIESVIAQTYQKWELLCVDDGSSDNSVEVLSSYANKDSRIKYFTQVNKGPLLARRLGFENSSGDYVIYLDADDEYSPDNLQSLVSRIQETNADTVAPDMIYKSDTYSKSWNQLNSVDLDEELDGFEAFSETFPWRKLHNFNLWKREIFEKATYHSYLENNNFNADEILQRIMLLNCKKVVFSRTGAYIRNYNDESITNVLQKRSFNRLDANEKLVQLGKDYNVSEEVMKKIHSFALFCQLKGLMLSYYSSGNSFTAEDKKWVMNKMRDSYKEYTRYPMNDFYGSSLPAKLKQSAQVNSFMLFKLLCFIQVKFS